MDPVLRDTIRRGYDALASEWEAWSARATPPVRERYVEKLLDRLPPDAAVLDLGCGPGVPVAAALAEHGHRVIGVDLSARMVEVARENVPAATFIEADMAEFEFGPASFDGCVACCSLIHIPRDELPRLLGRIRTWLKPGALFVVTFGTEDLPLGAGPTAWSSSETWTSLRLVDQAGFETEEAEVVTQQEPEGVVRFLWVVARA